MNRKTICRFCEISSTEKSGFIGKGGRRPFAVPGSSPHYAPDRFFRTEHIRLDLVVDPEKKILQGTASQRIRSVVAGQTLLKLDQIDLQIDEVRIGKEKISFVVEENSLYLQLKSPSIADESFEVVIHYRAPHPKRGVYFTGPDKDYPNKPYQVWTQSQDEDSRYWFPCLDYPNQKATSEVIVTVPLGYTAVSNGALISKKGVGDRVQFHYSLGTPQVTYLMTLVVARFSEWSDSGPRGVPVQYFVEPGRESDGKRAFSDTPRMIEVFEHRTGVPYPYEKYSQVAVQDFIFGGMENTSATTQTDLTLHDERAHIDFSSGPLVSHELAHQWFGDLVTCRDWSHGWLNEGFATFMERVWVESDPGPNGGTEEGKYYSYQDWKEYLADDQSRYRRPIVCNDYIEPIDLFDTHLYQKGGLVLHLIRTVLGDEAFWKSIQLYLTRHRGQNVETLDLIRAIEETTGRNLRRFFDEWVFNAGYPEFEISYQWHEDKKLTEWTIEQKQTSGAPFVTKDGATTFLFHLPVVIELTLGDGTKLIHRIEIGEARERLFLPVSSRPLMVRFDPNFTIPKTLKFPRPKEMLLYQLRKDTDCMGRIEAAQELAKNPDLEVIEALGKTALEDSFWGVQAEAAKALAEIKSDAALDALIRASGAKNAKARRAIVSALGGFRDQRAVDALKGFVKKDESYFVEADATYAWTTASLNPSQIDRPIKYEELERVLIQQLDKNSYRDVIRAAALKSLAELPGVEKGNYPKALNTLIEWSRRGHATDVRSAAVRALGEVLKRSDQTTRSRILEVLSHLSEEENFRLRMQMIPALESSGLSEVTSILARLKQYDTDGRVKRGAQLAMDTLATSGGVPESVSNLKDSLQKLEEDYRKLRALVEEKLR